MSFFKASRRCNEVEQHCAAGKLRGKEPNTTVRARNREAQERCAVAAEIYCKALAEVSSANNLVSCYKPLDDSCDEPQASFLSVFAVMRIVLVDRSP